jgi:hypothetical protein
MKRRLGTGPSLKGTFSCSRVNLQAVTKVEELEAQRFITKGTHAEQDNHPT